ncbi:MAG: Dehydratase medium subunit [Gaiellales bacterium]|nr:Dehydratase medium subunit [Gaiellales bacterium]
MSEPLVLALVAADVPDSSVRALQAGFEEEGVPLAVERGEGASNELGRSAAARALLGLGIGVDPAGACAVLAAAPAASYLQAAPADLRAFAQDAARIAGRRPLRRRPATWV